MQSKKRYPRIEREVPVEVQEDENAHLWAISYSDFLMALLSFFILFFSMDDQKQSQLILTLADDFTKMSGGGGAGALEKKTFASKDNDGSLEQKELPKGLDQVLKELNVKLNKEEETLVIDFPADFFATGKYQLTGSQNELMDRVLEKIKPYQSGIKLYFEGHTDDKPSQARVNNIVIDNFLLSSLRASNALFKARQMGFEEKNMYIRAVSSNLRNTRSLSLRIVPRNVEGL